MMQPLAVARPARPVGRPAPERFRARWRRLALVLDAWVKLAAGLLLTGSLQTAALANPQGGSVADGAARIEHSGNRVDIHQATDRVVIDWRSFSIAAGEITEFHQPSSSSIALNRVTGADPSHIFGTLRANGRVFLVNPNGILFGVGSRVDVSGLVATTSDIRNHDFMAGRMEFGIPSLDPRAAVVNEGEISIADAGYAALVAPHVRNSGVINARLGRVTLGAADSFAIDLYGDELVAFRVGVSRTPVDAEGAARDALVANDGRILADGGIVQLAARNVEAVVRNVINTDGVVYANAIERQGGRIVFKAVGPGAVAVAGDVSATGGQVEITGDGDVAVTGATVAAETVAITADADRSGAGDANAGPSGGDALITDAAIVARTETAAGGRVTVTGDRVAVTGTSRIDASAGTGTAAGGGEVLIGGDFQGKGTLRNADATIVGADATIRADAGDAGDGGRVILWADGYTRFHGDISARGGASAGDGGFVEVSGKENLDFRGTVDVPGPAGAAGTLLLDPVNIVVSLVNIDGANGGTIAFADAPALEPWNVSPAALDAVGGNILLQATNNITIDNAVNLTTAGATFTATARNDINVNASVTTNNAAITLTADSDGSGVGEVTVAGGQTVTTGGAALTLSANDITLTGNLNSGAGSTTILVSDGGTIGLGATANDLTISDAELGRITATGLVIGDATNGDVIVDGITAANSNNITGTVTVNATAAAAKIEFKNTASTFNALAANAGNEIVVDLAITTDTGGLTLSAGDKVTLSDSVTTAGVTQITADNDGNGSGDFILSSSKFLNTGGNALTITANDMDIAGTINSGAASTTLLVSDGGTIGLGATAGNMTISGAELQNITATGLVIGSTANGNITVDGITAANSNNITGTVTLNATGAGRSIAFSNTASTFNALTASADDGIAVNVALTTDTGSLALDGDADNAADGSDNVAIAAGLTLTSAGMLTLDATTGGIAGAGALTLNAVGGVTLNDSLTTAGTTTIDADSDDNGAGTFTIAAAKTLSTGGNALSITADDAALSGALNSGAAATTILVSDGGTIGLGVTAGNMTISGAELQNITATGLTIGDATNKNVTVDGITAANSNNITGTVTINATNSSRNVEFSNTASVFNALTVNAGKDVLVDAALTTDTGGLALSAGKNVTLNEGVTSAGAVIIDADSDDSGNGTFTVAALKALNTSGNTLSVTANKMIISGTINSGAQSTTLLASNGAAFVLGSATDLVANTVELSGTEIQNITATGLVIGDATSGNITVDGITAANSNNITGTVTLNATQAGSSVTFSGTASTFNALAVNAASTITTSAALTTDTGGLTASAGAGITFSENVTTAGTTTIDADSDDNGVGTFTVAAAKTLSTGGNALSITADDVALNGALNSGAAATTILVSDGSTIRLGTGGGAGLTISGAELQNITATGLTIGDTTNGTITVNGVTAAESNNVTGTLTLNATKAGSNVDFVGATSTFNALTVNAGGTVTIGDLVTDTGALTVNAVGGITVGGDVTTAGAVTIDADSDDSGAGTFTVDAGKTLSSGGNTLTITADDIALNGALNSGAAATTILVSDGGTIGLGATAGNMTISGAELQNITATGLTLGDATSGNITVNGITAANSDNVSGTVTLNATGAGRSIAFATTASTFNALTASADNGIAVNADLTTDTGALALDGDADNAADGSDNVTFAAGRTVTSAGVLTLDATTGGLTGAGALTLNAVAGITLNHNLTTAGTTTIDADSDDNGAGTFTVAATKTLSTGGNALSITADDVTISGTLNSGAAATTILVSDGGTIGLGATAGGLTISGAELQNITATGLTIGDATGGNITVDGITAANSNNITGTVTLNATGAGRSIAFSTTASTFNALTASADDGIAVNVALTTDTGSLTLDGDADNAADGSDNVAIAAGLTLTSAGALTLDATTGGIAGAGALTLNAVGGVTLNDSLTTAGTTTIDADSDDNGAGTFTIAAAKTLSTGGNALSITADDIALNGALNSGAAATTILVSDGGTIGLGATAGGLTISGAELQNITATGLTLGDATSGNITVDGITAANSNNVSGTVTLNATRNGAAIFFSNTASTFNGLAASADDGIAVNVNLSTDTSGLTLDGDADNAADASDSIAFAAGVTVTSAITLLLDATTGGMTGAGALNLDAGASVAMNDSLTTAGATVIRADTDANGLGSFTLAAGKALSTGGNTLSITADDVVLTGTINTGAAATTILVSDGGTIGLGATAGGLTISGAELQNITATGLTLGDATNGNITVDGITAANSNNITGTVTLNATQAGSAVAFSTAASTFNALAVNAATTITNTVGLVTDTGGLTASAGAGITFSENVTTAGTTTIDADSDDNGAGTFTIAAAKTLSTGGNALSITADDVVLTGTLNSGAAATTILVSDGGTIGLGATAGGLTISGAELQNITATGLVIGSTANGNITVDGITAANSNNVTGTVTLNATGAGRSIAFSNTASTFNALTASADDGIAVNVALTTDTGSLTLDGDADNAADGSDNVAIAAGLTLTSAGALTLDATSGGIAGAGALTLNADAGVTLSASFTAAGNTVIAADADTSGSGNFATTAAINVGANSLGITGVNVNTGSSLTAGATTLTGAVTGSGLTVTALTLAGASASLNSVNIGGLTAGAAAAATNMPDAATHTVNNCRKTGCVTAAPPTTTPPPADIDTVQAPPDSGGSGSGSTGGNTGGNSGGGTGGQTSGGDTSGGGTTGDTQGGGSGTGTTTGGDGGAGTGGGTVGSGNWSGGSFNPAAGDLVLSDSVGAFRVFLQLLKEDETETLELLMASENLDNPEVASLVRALGEILGEYDFVATAIPTNAFNDEAATLLPGLLTFDPAAGDDVAAADGGAAAAGRSGYAPPSFGRFQF